MERMIDDVTALQCDPFNPQDIADKIEYLMTKSGKAEEMGRNAREFIVRYYDWDERAKIYPQIFDAIMEGNFTKLDDIPLVVHINETEFASSNDKIPAF